VENNEHQTAPSFEREQDDEEIEFLDESKTNSFDITAEEDDEVLA
jgi:hypothetical protein